LPTMRSANTGKAQRVHGDVPELGHLNAISPGLRKNLVATVNQGLTRTDKVARTNKRSHDHVLPAQAPEITFSPRRASA
jgi:hypothetical protein